MLIQLLSYFELLLLKKYSLGKLFLTKAPSRFLELHGRLKYRLIILQAANTISAYRDFLNDRNISLPKTIFSKPFYLPCTDKQNYILKYSILERSVRNRLPQSGSIDESAGSTGKPLDWVRSTKEEKKIFANVRFLFDYIFQASKTKPLVINSWSTGPWATGIKFSMLAQQNSLVKATGTSVEKVIDTIKIFGQDQYYIISGYPPFIKQILDEGESIYKMNWKLFNIDFISGGEGFIEPWRDYVLSKVKEGGRVISAYGASDIDVGIAFETDCTIKIKRFLMNKSDLTHNIFGCNGNPIFFGHYDITSYWAENITVNNGFEKKQEVIFTSLNPYCASPKICYNLHDRGGIVSLREFKQKLLINGISWNEMLKECKINSSEVLQLPFFYTFGRTDGTLSFDGANVYPKDIEEGIYANKKFSGIIHSYMMQREFDQSQNIHFNIAIELNKDFSKSQFADLEPELHDTILNKLLHLNRDFKESYTNNTKLDPKIKIYDFEQGPFKADLNRIKLQHIRE